MMHYEYYRNLCVCPWREVFLPMRRLDEINVPYAYPVVVYNINSVAIGVAANKAQYISVWNANMDNRAIGILNGLPGPFSFSLAVRPTATAPAFVLGDTCELLVDGNGAFVVDDDGFYIGSICAVSAPSGIFFSNGFSNGFLQQP